MNCYLNQTFVKNSLSDSIHECAALGNESFWLLASRERKARLYCVRDLSLFASVLSVDPHFEKLLAGESIECFGCEIDTNMHFLLGQV